MTEQITILKRRLECRSCKSTLDILKRIFNVIRGKPWLGAAVTGPDWPEPLILYHISAVSVVDPGEGPAGDPATPVSFGLN